MGSISEKDKKRTDEEAPSDQQVAVAQPRYHKSEKEEDALPEEGWDG